MFFKRNRRSGSGLGFGVLLSCVVSAGAVLAGCSKQTGGTESQSAEPSEKGHAMSSHWSYQGHDGPSHWGDLDPLYELCKTGARQSPIDIIGAARNAALRPLAVDYRSTSVKVTNNGHAIQVDCDEGSVLHVEGRDFALLQFHFHSPSEHWVDGKPFAMESHFVHQDADGNLVVIGVLMVEGRENPALAKFWDYMPMLERSVDTDVTIQVSDLLPKEPRYHTYEGSLTTPPCSEDVLWFVMKTPLEVSKKQVEAFLAAIGENARPVQPRNDRVIEEY